MQNEPITNLVKYIKTKYGTKAINHYLNKEYPNKRYSDWKLWEYLKNATSRNNKKYPLDYTIIDRKIFKIAKSPKDDKHPRIHSVSRLFQKIKRFSVRNYLNERKLLFEWLFLKSVQDDKSNMYPQALNQFKTHLKSNTNTEWQHYIGHHYHLEKYRHKDSNENPKIEDLKLSYQYLEQFYQQRLTLLNLEISDNNKDKGIRQSLFGNLKFQKENPQTPISELQNKLHDFDSSDKNALEKYATLIAQFEQMYFERNYKTNELVKVLEFLINIATRAFREGQQQLLRFHLNNLQRLGFQEKLLFENDKLPIKQYINFMSIILAIRGTEELTRFATKYIIDIIDEDEHIATYFKDVFITFHNHHFEEVIEIINRNEQNVHPKKNLFIKLRIYTFLIRSCYEIEVISAWQFKSSTFMLNEKLNNFEIFLKRNQLNIPNVVAFQNFIKTIKTLKKQPDIKELFNLTKDIFTNPNTHQTWLLKKIDEAIDFQLS